MDRQRMNAVDQIRPAPNTTLVSSSATPPTTSSSTRTRARAVQHDRLHGSHEESRSSAESVAANARHFVSNVGPGGNLYLRPSRVPASPQHLVTLLPATPPDTAQSKSSVQQQQAAWPLLAARSSDASAVWTPKLRGSVNEHNVPVPPLSLANPARRRKARSYSVSTASDAPVTSAMDALAELQYVVNQGRDSRPKRSLDLSDGLIHLHIPHYRLGTPRFSERGTAYLHNSIYTNSTDDARSSVLSQQAYDRLFPLPPGKANDGRTSFVARQHVRNFSQHRAYSSYWHSPYNATVSSVFDRIEANPNDPAIVRFSAQQPRLLAATVPRLIVQITSPRFLDYELLSDFFLTFRGFITTQELLDWLLARLRWAISNSTDAGRIVRVRTFVAMRHWILNYFSDDFVDNLDLRRSFCDNVNQLSIELNRQSDSAGDLNVLGELKKCWRRTSASFWPVTDAMHAGPLDNILPGGETDLDHAAAPEIDLLKSGPQGWLDTAQTPRITSQLIAFDRRSNQRAKVVSIVSDGSGIWVQRGSIPASPMSEESLHILSCSIPFLHKLRPDAKAEKRAQMNAPRPVLPQRRNSMKGDSSTKLKPPTESRHRRERSFNDSVRDNRTPLPAAGVDPVGLEELPNVALTGGLVRGLLLQPPPALVGPSAPRSPAEKEHAHSRKQSEDYFNDEPTSPSLRRIVGDMRRALSVKKNSSESSSRTLHAHSASGSKSSNNAHSVARSESSLGAATKISTESRKDVLAARIETSYRKEFTDYEELAPTTLGASEETNNRLDINKKLPRQPSPGSWRALTIPDFRHRFGSDVTSRSRSIVIMDATSMAPPAPRQGLTESHIVPATTTNSFAQFDFSFTTTEDSSVARSSLQHYLPPDANHSETQSLDGRLHDSFVFPRPLHLRSRTQAVQSPKEEDVRQFSEVNAESTTESRTVNRLRRRPGGDDLRAADHVHELEAPFPPGMGPSQHLGMQSSEPTLRASQESAAGTLTDAKNSKLGRSASSASAKSSHMMERSSSQPHLRPSFRSEARRLAHIREELQVGGIEETLARLEGKIRNRSSNQNDSRTSWLAPSTDEAALIDLDLPNATYSNGSGIDLEMLNSNHMTNTGNAYRMSSADLSAETSVNPAGSDEKIVVKSPHRPDTHDLTIDVAGREDDKFVVSGPGVARDMASAAQTIKSSFLLDDNQSLSGISTDMESDGDDDSAGVRSFFFDENASNSNKSKGSLKYKNGEVDRARPPPLKIATSAAKILGIPADTIVSEIVHPRSKSVQAIMQEGDHMPFVLAFESDVIAHQLCIIEKDALDEIDWKDLIALNWQHAPPPVRNWVAYLKQEESNGIDLVIARFNLTVKWVVSECILTQSAVERARCISKFIHIATHCLRLRNYASMYQITLALLSSDLTRLQRTWSLVSSADKRLLDRLELLCQPIRNFHNLRVEMESSSPEEGCIPFIGLYTHDLTYNAQKPAQLQAVPPNEFAPPLINFERYQTAASITKSLLRLLEASAKYAFRPHPEALSRCLWLAALDDVDIHEMGMSLE